MDWVLSLTQVLGGCCSNVFLFEKLLNDAKEFPDSPDIGSLVTFCQFVLVALVSAYPLIDSQHSSWRRLYLRQTHIPIAKLTWMVSLFFVVSVLNNSVWRFGLSVPIHIMFRSSSTVITMTVGYFFGGKHYSRIQVLSSILVSVGAILAISLRNTDRLEWLIDNVDWRFAFGILVLSTASVLGAFLGIYTENIYARYGNHWQEMLFYTHLLGIPLFGILGSSIFHDIKTLWSAGSRIVLSKNFSLTILELMAYLLLNCVSQVICARGVNYLCGIASSLTVTIVLLGRKFVSLALSAYVFGNHFNKQGYLGAGILVVGTVLYSIATLQRKPKVD
ncbi:CIC11C00000003652 [Sungouiella intermedia]|uniref:CIC11C00000003652 n=1 Tax=Sungouiella intermedia TaxID=45354 RepID=A0A1L0GD00_9ASCO|nr:CIC11C00000003652 [[Candida] intermedia]